MARFSLTDLDHPIIQAPLAGGPSTPALAAAVCEAGGLGFLGAGYKSPGAVREDLDELRRRTERPFGVNLFAPPGAAADPAVVERYAATLRSEGELGEPRHDDDHWEAKLARRGELPPAVVSTSFGCPSRTVLEELHGAGAEVWVTV